ncbi:unnamed protein product [Cyprideis torosa]|uniref:Uncharacterized protein n=1 Tax=Cyprideis torosa TaxID=163714 RepID=A0A7R8W6B1_9CRUS|nr:unnamed protein product [Cyprideis torosa]CAG0885043.1 unnamed protein product [Cyprideis torosa]
MSHSVLQLPADPASDDGEDNASETYVDLDRGIDSDIELTAVTTRANPLSSSSGAEGPADVHCSALEVPSDRRDADSSPGDHVQRVSSPESVLVSKSDVPMLDRSLSPSHTPAPCDVPECVPSEPPSGDPTPTEGSGQDLQSESERLIGHSGLPPTEISCLSGAAAAEKESSVESEICPVEKAASSEDGAIVSPGSHSVLLTDQPDPPSYCSTVTLTIENEKPPVLAQSPTTEPDIATVVEPAVSCSEEETAETIPSRRMSPPRSSDTRMSPPRSPDTRMSPPRSPDTRMSPPRSSDTRMSPPRSPDTRMSPPRSPDEIVLPPPPPPIKFTLPPPSTPPGGTGFEDNFDPEDWSYGCARRSSAPVVNGALVASTPKDHRKTPRSGVFQTE